MSYTEIHLSVLCPIQNSWLYQTQSKILHQTSECAKNKHYSLSCKFSSWGIYISGSIQVCVVFIAITHEKIHEKFHCLHAVVQRDSVGVQWILIRVPRDSGFWGCCRILVVHAPAALTVQMSTHNVDICRHLCQHFNVSTYMSASAYVDIFVSTLNMCGHRPICRHISHYYKNMSASQCVSTWSASLSVNIYIGIWICRHICQHKNKSVGIYAGIFLIPIQQHAIEISDMSK